MSAVAVGSGLNVAFAGSECPKARTIRDRDRGRGTPVRSWCGGVSGERNAGAGRGEVGPTRDQLGQLLVHPAVVPPVSLAIDPQRLPDPFLGAGRVVEELAAFHRAPLGFAAGRLPIRCGPIRQCLPPLRRTLRGSSGSARRPLRVPRVLRGDSWNSPRRTRGTRSDRNLRYSRCQGWLRGMGRGKNRRLLPRLRFRASVRPRITRPNRFQSPGLRRSCRVCSIYLQSAGKD